MAIHMSIRLAWHSDGWNGHICKRPCENSYCIGQHSYPGDLIASTRDLEFEAAHAGESCSALPCKAACGLSVNAFGKDTITVRVDPPSFWKKNDADAINITLPPSTVCTWCYEAMYNDEVEARGATAQKYDYAKRKEGAENYFAQFEPGKSLIFYYAGYSNPFSENEEDNYVIVGVSRVSKIGDTFYYDNTSDEVKRKYAGGFVWQKPVTSTYPDEGFCIPYWKYMDDEEILNRIVIKPQNRGPFKYGSREVYNDDAIEVVNQLIAVVDTLIEIGDDTEDWNKRKAWLNSVLNELWTARGPYPGFPSILESLGLHTFVSSYIGLTFDDEMKEYRIAVREFLEGNRDDVQGMTLSKSDMKKIRREYQLLDDDTADFMFEILSRFDLRADQVCSIVSEDRENVSITASIAEMKENPYIIFEQYIGYDSDDVIPFYRIDNGVIPSPEYGIDEILDCGSTERLRAFCVDELNRIAAHSFGKAKSILKTINTLRVKMKNAEDIDGIDLATITAATIDAKSPAFLLEELRKQFNEFKFEPEYNLQENLCENIEFVFGPPGTGKTTHLAANVILPIMKNSRECKVLVLTPTNKSADVLVRRIMEISKQDKAYEDWLVRFGGTGDEEIEQSPVFRDKTFDIRTLTKNVTVTTIARFPYDFFMPQGARVFLNGINWDYIIIDEASMIPLANIVYPLYKKTPKRFIIAGDPFQIEPITSVDLWKNENIYTMVHLDSFVKPETIPYQYKVELLTTQYRSVPDIGGIFSNFAYGGILKHNRSVESQRPLNVGNDLGIETLNIIKFPVSKYESIYRCKRLQHSSSYQVYSAIFTFEYVSYLSRAIAKNNPGELFKIGVIAPYRAQADMIDKLLASEKLPKEVDVQVGTIHGFQGDECDIIFAVFNTPPTISASKDMFLNKRNIINVSISRARDYLFVVMPDDDTDNISNLRLVKRVESLIQSTDAWNEFLTPDLEELMFGDAKYLENNAFSTSHQSVNVYGLPEKIYEVRTEDTAVDVQIHRSTSKKEEVDPTLASGTVVVDEPQYMDSYDLDESLIPEELRDTAIDLPVRGAINGWCYLVPYEGKLKSHTVKKVIGMFIPQNRNGQEKMVSVSVVKEDRIIYISKDMFKIYEQSLSEPDGIQLKRTFF